MNETFGFDVDGPGPQLGNSFDFTLYFEQAILSIVPSTLFLTASPFRIVWLSRKGGVRDPAQRSWLLYAKLGAAAVHFCLQLALVALWALPSAPKTAASVPAAALGLLDAGAIAALLYAEHKHSARPSKLLSVYLFLSALVGLAQARSLFLRHALRLTPIASLFTAGLVTKVVLLLLEEVPKTTYPVKSSEVPPAESASGPLNRSVFGWLNPLFLAGARDVLGVQDLGGIDRKFDSARLLEHLGSAWDKSDKSAKHCLLASTLSAYRVAYLTPILPRLCLAAFSFSQPFLIKRVIDFVSEPEDGQTGDVAGGLVGAAFLIYLGLAISRCIYNHSLYQLTTMLRGGLVSLIFTKSLELDAATASEGSAVTLMSTDIYSIASGVKDLHEIWASVLELGVAVYLLSRQIGPACFVVIIPAIICTFVTERATDGIGPAKVAWNQGVQQRVSTTSSMLSQIKGIKMMGLTDYFSSVVHKLRVSELDQSKKFRMFIVRIILIANFSDQLTPAAVVTAAVFWTRADGFSISQAFTSLAIVALVSTPLANLIGSYPTFVSSVACFGRIQEFLLSPAHDSQGHQGHQGHSSSAASDQQLRSPTPKDASRPPSVVSGIEMTTSLDRQASPHHGHTSCITLRGVSVTAEGRAEPILKDVTLSLQSAGYTAIVGPVGCGKSTLLKTILGEQPVASGTVHLPRGGRSIAYCDQEAWLRNISVKANILGQDAFDEKWYASVIHACALEEDISRFPRGGETLVGSGGITLSGGQKQRVALARALYARKRIVLLDDVFSALDAATSGTVFRRILGAGGLLRNVDTSVVLATHGLDHLHSADMIVVLDKHGTIEQQCSSFSDPQKADGFIKDLNIPEILTHDNPDVEQAAAADPDPDPNPGTPTDSPSPDKDASPRQTGDFALYKFYLDSIGPALVVSFSLLAAAYIGLGTMPAVWLRIWTEHGTATTDRGAYFGAYLLFCLGTVASSGLAVWLFFVVVIPRSATRLHRQLLDGVLAAPLRFFAAVDAGVTLNRFSQDMTLVDQTLPTAFFEVALDTLVALAAAALIASGARYFAAVIPVCVAPLYLLQKYYLRTSRQMRHLDLESKSPLYTHFSEALGGVVTIRAFGWQRGFVDEQLRLLDVSQKPYYLLFCIQRWLAVVLDLFVAGIATVLVALAVKFTGTTSSGAIGLSMVNLIGLNTSLSRLISSWTNLETSLGAIARLRDFVRDTPKEDEPRAEALPPVPHGWPSAGAIDFAGVTATYHAPDESVLRELSLSIKPGQKVGICGRTGSGKTSLLLALLRLIDTPSGSVRIDNVDLSAHPRKAIRPHINTLPQDPVRLPGTIRKNLDPGSVLGAASDADLIAALDRVFLWDGVVGDRGGLDADMDGMGLSKGQEQLFGLGRALLHKHRGRVVLLDEATSSVDHETDRKLQRVIRAELADFTVLAVAHRLETIVEYDVVVVMEQGRIVEVGDPRQLEKQDGPFAKLLAS